MYLCHSFISNKNVYLKCMSKFCSSHLSIAREKVAASSLLTWKDFGVPWKEKMLVLLYLVLSRDMRDADCF